MQEDVSTRKGVERIIRYAFEFASARGRRRVVMSDKSNAMRFVGDLWQRTFSEVSREFPAIEASHLYIDALCMQMVKDPRQFDVIVTNNMFGDIATDLGAALQGGLGMAASGNIHPGRVSMFEPVHGSAPKYAGTGKANPFGAILTAGLLLDHLGHRAEAAAVEAAVAACVREGAGDRRRRRVPHDLGGRRRRRRASSLRLSEAPPRRPPCYNVRNEGDFEHGCIRAQAVRCFGRPFLRARPSRP